MLLPAVMYNLALVLAGNGEAYAAARFAGFADGYADQHQLRPAFNTAAARSKLVERLYSTMSPEECKAAMAAGAAWSEEEAFAVAQAA
jgi:hypothetical protein